MNYDNVSIKKKLYYLLSVIIISVSVYLCLKFALPAVIPFVFAYLIVLMLEKPVELLSRLLKGKKSLAAAILIIIIAVISCVGIGYLLRLGIGEIRLFFNNYDYILAGISKRVWSICEEADAFMGLGRGVSYGCVREMYRSVIGNLDNNQMADMVKKVIGISFPILVKAAVVIGIIVICFISVVYLAGCIDKIRQCREKMIFSKEIAIVTTELKKLLNVYFRVQARIMGINSVVCIIGLFLIKNPYAVIIGLLIGVVDAFPFLASGTILIPWAIIYILFKDFYKAVILIILYIITYFVREIMESKCMGDKLGITPFTMLVIMFVGICVFGVFGFILGPIAYCVIKALSGYAKSFIL